MNDKIDWGKVDWDAEAKKLQAERTTEPQTQIPRTPSFTESFAPANLAGGLARGTRNVIEGSLALPYEIVDALSQLGTSFMNIGIPEEMKRKPLDSRKALSNVLNKLSPEDRSLLGKVTRYLSTAMTTMGAGAMLSGAKGVTGAVGTIIAEQPGTQLAGAAAAASAGGVGEKIGLGPKSQMALELIAGILPGAARSALTGKIKTAEEVAAQKFTKGTTGPDDITYPQKQQNLDDYARLQEEIPGLNLNQAAASGTSKEAAMIRSQLGAEARQAFDANLVKTTKDLNNYLETSIPKGNINKTVAAIKQEQSRLTGKVDAAETAGTAAVESLQGARTQMETGDFMRNLLKAEKIDSSKSMSSLWDKVPKNVRFDTGPLEQKIGEVFENVNTMLSDLSQIPSAANKLKKGFQVFDRKLVSAAEELSVSPETRQENIPRYMTTNELAELNKSITAAAREVGPQNRDLARRLYSLKDGIDDMVTQAMNDPANAEGATRLKNFWDTYRKMHAERFYSKPTQQVLERYGGQYKVEASQLPEQYFKPGAGGEYAAQQFQKAFGNNPEAQASIKEFISNKFYNEVTKQGNVTPTEADINRWVYRYQTALKNFGLEDNFSSMEQASQTLAQAKASVNEFNKGILGKLISADPGNIPKIIFKGDSPVKNTKILMSKIRSSPEAVAGLKASTKDFFKEQVEGLHEPLKAGENIFSSAKIHNFIKRKRPVLNEIYSSKEMAAYDNVLNVLKRMSLQQQSTGGVGSPTAELSQAGLKFLRTIPVFNRLYYKFGVAVDAFFQRNEELIAGHMIEAFYDPAKANELWGIARQMETVKNQSSLQKILGRMFVVQAPAIAAEEREL